MKTKNRSAKSAKKKNTGKKAAKKAVVPRSMVDMGKGFPKKLQFTHKYTENVLLSSSSGGLGTYKFSCNSLYDPNATGAGHQPMYMDQLTTLYDHYVVIGSKIKFTLIPGGTGNAPCAFGLNINDDTTVTPTDWTGLSEQTQSKVKYYAPNNTKPIILTSKWSAKKYFGKGILANTDLQGTVSSSPNEQSFYTLYVQALDLATSANHWAIVEIQYIAIWKELKDVAQS